MDHDDRDNAMLEERLSGRSVQIIARQHHCAIDEVEAVIDRRLGGEINNQMRLKAIKLDVARLEGLMQPFYERATKDKDVAAGTLCVKILERRALLLGLDSPTRVDIVQMQQAEQQVPRHEKIRMAIERLTGRAIDGNTRPLDDDNAVGVLATSDAKSQMEGVPSAFAGLLPHCALGRAYFHETNFHSLYPIEQGP